ncbi:MAG: ORF6N domain-containing protein [Steroidobacteraceae bacterium]
MHSCQFDNTQIADRQGEAERATSPAALLTRAVRCNPARLPSDFMFQLAVEEAASLRSQSGALKSGRGKHRKYAPYVFTEQGIAMLSSVLSSERAVQVNIEIRRAFIRL